MPKSAVRTTCFFSLVASCLFLACSLHQLALMTVPEKVTRARRERNLTYDHLLLCIPSAIRPGVSYLSRVLASIDRDIRNSGASSRVRVLVVDVSRLSRTDIIDARNEFPDFGFELLGNKTYEDCTEEQLLTEEGDDARPPCSVRQQTRDITAAMLQCADRMGESGWVMLVEDDTEMCEGAVRVMLQTLPRVARSSSFVALSSYFSGTAFTSTAAEAFARYASGRLGERPIDHLLWQDWGSVFSVRDVGNLFAHRGLVSAFEYRNSPRFHELWDGMRFSGRQSDCDTANAVASILTMVGVQKRSCPCGIYAWRSF